MGQKSKRKNESFFAPEEKSRKLHFATGTELAVWMILSRTRPRRWVDAGEKVTNTALE